MKELLKLIDVKTIVTFTVLAVFSILAIKGTILPENVMQVTLVIITFFFAKKAAGGSES